MNRNNIYLEKLLHIFFPKLIRLIRLIFTSQSPECSKINLTQVLITQILCEVNI